MTVSYPDLSNLTSGSGIAGLLALPNASYPWYWTIILLGLFVIITSILYYEDKKIEGRGNILASMAVSSLACILLAVLGSLIGIFTVTTLVPIIVFGLLIIIVWIVFSSKS